MFFATTCVSLKGSYLESFPGVYSKYLAMFQHSCLFFPVEALVLFGLFLNSNSDKMRPFGGETKAFAEAALQRKPRETKTKDRGSNVVIRL